MSHPRFLHLLLTAFLVWHMFAVAAYLLPSESHFQPIRKLSAPYVLSLSQWQKWDIFSPDPLRRVSDYRIEQQTGTGWETIRYMDFRSLPWTVRAKELKVLGRLEVGWEELTESYLLAQCDEYPGATVRLVVANTILPKDLPTLTRLSTTKLKTSEKILGTASCNSTL